MPIHRIRDEASHREALREIERLWNAAPGTEERETVGVLADLVELYESRHYRVPDADPIEVLEFAISDMGRSQKELGIVLGSSSRASEVMNRRRALTIDMIDKSASLAHPGCSPGEALPARLRPKAQALPRTHASRAPGPGLDLSLRPAILDPLFAPATALPGVGPKIEQLLDRLVGEPGRPARIVDLLFHLPHGGISRELKGSIAEAPVGETVTLKVRVTEHRPGPPRRGKAPFRILVEDDTGDILLVFFNAHPERIQALLPVGSVRYVSGKIEIWDGYRQMVHPDRILDERRIGELPAVEAVYGLTEGLSTRLVGKFVGAALERVPALPEWQDRAFLEQSRFPAFGEALHQLHRPAAAADVSPEAAAASPARRRLAYDELLASQLALALVRSRMRRLPGRSNAGDGRIAAKIPAALPFGLTGAQARALAEIRRRPRRRQAHAAPAPGRRRLRQDRGRAAGHGERRRGRAPGGADGADRDPRPPALRAHRAARPRRPACASRSSPAATRAPSAARAPRASPTGAIDIVVGTHALFQEDVAFRDLGLAVVDEQHRFGVHQRLALGAEGRGAPTCW